MLDTEKIYSYFEDNHGPLKRSTKGWYEAECPFCHSNKLSVNPEYGAVKCWKGCFKGSVVNFVKEYLGATTLDAYTILDDMIPKLRFSEYMTIPTTLKRDITLPEGYSEILSGTTPMAKRARNYLEGRGFDLNYLDMIGVGYSTSGDYFGYIIIPFKKDGKVVYFIGRDYLNRGDKERYKNPNRDEFGIGKTEVLFNEEALFLFKKVYLLEGWADAATIGNNATSIQGGSLSDIQAQIIVESPVEEVVVVPDVGAEKQGVNIVERLYKHKLLRMLNIEALSMLGKDVNEIGADKIFALEEKSTHIKTLADFYYHARSINPRKAKFIN